MKKAFIPRMVVAVALLGVVLAAVRPWGGWEESTRTEFLMDTVVQSVVFTRETRQGQGR